MNLKDIKEIIKSLKKMQNPDYFGSGTQDTILKTCRTQDTIQKTCRTPDTIQKHMQNPGHNLENMQNPGHNLENMQNPGNNLENMQNPGHNLENMQNPGNQRNFVFSWNHEIISKSRIHGSKNNDRTKKHDTPRILKEPRYHSKKPG